MNLNRRSLTPEAAYVRAMGLCARREKTHAEIREKLFSWGISGIRADEIISKLISADFLNEERYATAFARDKANLNHWGPRKIETALKAKGVSPRNIATALKSVDPSLKQDAIRALMRRYSGRLKGMPAAQAKLKMARYLIGKGFEPSQVWKTLGEED